MPAYEVDARTKVGDGDAGGGERSGALRRARHLGWTRGAAVAAGVHSPYIVAGASQHIHKRSAANGHVE